MWLLEHVADVSAVHGCYGRNGLGGSKEGIDDPYRVRRVPDDSGDHRLVKQMWVIVLLLPCCSVTHNHPDIAGHERKEPLIAAIYHDSLGELGS